MQKQKTNLNSLLKLVLLLLTTYLICRLLFYFFNYTYFSDLSVDTLLFSLLIGIKFDFAIIIIINSLFILLFLFPAPFREKIYYQKSTKFLFIIINSIAILANCIDLAYFPFTLKRTTVDVFSFFSGEIGNDLGTLMPLFLKDYWYVFLFWIILTVFLSYSYKKIVVNESKVWDSEYRKKSIITYILVIGISIVGYRGGFQLKPISIVSAGEYVDAKYIPLVISTPFAIVKTMDMPTIEAIKYFSDNNEIVKHYQPKKKYYNSNFKKMNVVLIALESFSKEYISTLNKRNFGYTPFLDSLIKESLVFTNAFSNGKKSIDGIPAITASIPTWMNEPYITSAYGSNQIYSLANILKSEGYSTSFFHGATNGSMGFDAFSSLSGFTNYYGRYEYSNDEDYDGNWGIWDEEFLQFSAQKLNQTKQPFFSTIFTLTSHHPFTIPEKYSSQFPEGLYYNSSSISYTDYSLKLFFETAKKMPWFNNTLFVLCADHTGMSGDAFYENNIGNNAIPIIYYAPDKNLVGIDTSVTQQIDIMPSILNYLNYNKPFFSFGNSVFDSTETKFALTYNSGIYQYSNDNYTLQFDGEKSISLYQYKIDSLLKNNLIKKERKIVTDMELKAKAIIQTYQQSLINNKML